MFKGDYRQAAIVGRRAVAANAEFSNAYKPLIAALGHLGRIEEAGPYVERLLQLEQNFTIKRFIELYPDQEGLRPRPLCGRTPARRHTGRLTHWRARTRSRIVAPSPACTARRPSYRPQTEFR